MKKKLLIIFCHANKKNIFIVLFNQHVFVFTHFSFPSVFVFFHAKKYILIQAIIFCLQRNFSIQWFLLVKSSLPFVSEIVWGHWSSFHDIVHSKTWPQFRGRCRTAATSKMDPFVTIVKGFRLLTIFIKYSIFHAIGDARWAYVTDTMIRLSKMAIIRTKLLPRLSISISFQKYPNMR